MSRKPAAARGERVARDTGSGAAPLGLGLERAALAIILFAAVARPFLAEMPYRVSNLVLRSGGGDVVQKPPDELVRVSWAMLLLLAAVLWAASLAVRPKVRVRGLAAMGLLAALAAWGFIGAWRAIDVRGALDGWIEQVSLVLAGLVMLNLSNARRLGLVVAVLAALGGTLGLKAIAQAAEELPQLRQRFAEDPAGQLAEAGIAPGSPQARMFERRVNDPAAIGYQGLSNILAAMLVVTMLAAAGAAAERLAAARADLARSPPGKGEVPLPLVAAALATALAVAAAAGLFLTRSKGGIAAGAAAVAAATGVAWKRAWLARHRRLALWAAGLTLALLLGATTAWGLARGTLPGRSFEVRWEYWIGSARIVDRQRLWGVGMGNFGEAYLRERLPAASESTKTAHNIIMDAAVAWGLPGAALYLLLLGWMLVKMTGGGGVAWPGRCLPWPCGCRTAPSTEASMASPPTTGQANDGQAMPPTALARPLVWLILLPLAALVARVIWLNVPGPAVLFFEALLPALALAVMLLVALWSGQGLDVRPLAGPWARIALGAGLAGFAAHNLVEYGLLTPPAATLFWVGAGALAGAGASAGREIDRRFTAPAAIGLVSLLALAAAHLWLPVARRTAHTLAAEQAYARGDIEAAAGYLERAAAADQRDGIALADLTRLYLTLSPGKDGYSYAEVAAERAWQRQPTSLHADLLADALWYRAWPSERACEWNQSLAPREQIERLEQLARDRPHPVILCQLAQLYYLDGQVERAYRTLLLAAAGPAETRWPKLYEHLGNLAFELGHEDDARRHWRQYDILGPPNENAKRSLAMSAKAVELDPMNVRLRMKLARRLLAAREDGAAGRQLEQALEIERQLPPDSDLRLTEAERRDLARLVVRAGL